MARGCARPLLVLINKFPTFLWKNGSSHAVDSGPKLPGDVKVPLRRGGQQLILEPIGAWCMQHAICLVCLEHQPARGAELGETKDTKLPSQLVETASMAVARTN
jgi:hypothetical protein